jgi:hypothetical protein
MTESGCLDDVRGEFLAVNRALTRVVNPALTNVWPSSYG